VSGAIIALEVEIVGLVIVVIVVEPPNETAEPFIVIAECCNLLLEILPANFASVTVPSLGVPIETDSPKTKTKSIVSVESGAEAKTIFVPLILKEVPGVCITPDTEHITLFSEPAATAAPPSLFVNANVVVEPSAVRALHLT